MDNQYQKSKQFPPKIQTIVNNFNLLISNIQNTEWKKSIAKTIKTYNVKLYNLDKITINRIKEMYYSIVEKFYLDQRNKQSWHQNQLRVYVWLLFTYANSLKKSPEEFNEYHWDLLSNVFSGKSAGICEFQYQSLKKLNEKGNKWTIQEDDLLMDILKEKAIKNKWNEIAKEFFIKTNKKSFRTPKQCRQRWNNYLDPSKTRQEWTNQEDEQLVKLVINKGKKWALISKILTEGRRTEHMVKNRFNSLMVKFSKHQNNIPIDTIELQELQIWVANRINAESESRQRSIKKSAQQIDQKKQNIKVEPRQDYVIPKKVVADRFEKPQDRKEENITPLMMYDAKSPAIFISPLPINYTPMMFSPYRDFNGSMNAFSFENIRES